MVELYSVCGEWKKQDDIGDWEFVVDKERGGSLCEVDSNVTYKVLAEMIIEDYAVPCLVDDIKLSYDLPPKMKSVVEDSHPLYVRNDRQLQMFIKTIQEEYEIIRLCVMVAKQSDMVVFDKVGSNLSAEAVHVLKYEISQLREELKEYHRPSGSCIEQVEAATETCSTAEKENSIGSSYYTQVVEDIHVGQYFRNKEELMMKMRKWAVDGKFEFRSMWSDTKRLVLGCVDVSCSWRMRATKLKSSDFFVVKHYTHQHTCDTSQRNANHRQATSKLLSTFICSHFGEKKAGLKPSQIIERVKVDYGVHINYKKAWRAKDAAQLLVRGTAESLYDSLLKITIQ